jgi:hypothetical protein
MQWWWVGAAFMAVAAGFYVGWDRCGRRVLRIMDERFKSM